MSEFPAEKRIYCNRCRIQTRHRFVASHRYSTEVEDVAYILWACAGCDTGTMEDCFTAPWLLSKPWQVGAPAAVEFVTSGGTPVTLILDTGVQGILLFERRLYARVPALRTTGPSAEALAAQCAPGQSVGRRPRPPTNLRPDVLLIEAPSDEILPGIDGLLGTGPLIARHVNFDFVTGTLRWGMIR